MATLSPLRIAIAGLGREGTYHRERIGLRDDLSIVATCEPAAERGTGWRAVLDDPAVELVLLCTPAKSRPRLAAEVLEAGRHVAMGLPLASTPDQADALLDVARRSGCVLAVLPHRRWDDDFATALAELRSGRLGPLRSAKRLLWDYVIRDPETPAQPALERLGPDLLDQMLQFFEREPEAVTARLNEDGSEFAVTVRFEDGATALLDADLAAVAPLRTGWVLQGTAGAWQNFRRFTKTDEDEIYETPVEPLPTLWDEAYVELVRVVRTTEPGEIPPATLDARAVVELMAAAHESARTGRAVKIKVKRLSRPAVPTMESHRQ